MNTKERIILEKYFKIYEREYSNSIFYELEQWTNGGVDMIIALQSNSNESITQQFIDYIDNFDIDEEIDFYRESDDYKNAFTISESLEDFKNWVEYCNNVKKELLSNDVKESESE